MLTIYSLNTFNPFHLISGCKLITAEHIVPAKLEGRKRPGKNTGGKSICKGVGTELSKQLRLVVLKTKEKSGLVFNKMKAIPRTFPLGFHQAVLNSLTLCLYFH